jgi:hypothetical protein
MNVLQRDDASQPSSGELAPPPGRPGGAGRRFLSSPPGQPATAPWTVEVQARACRGRLAGAGSGCLPRATGAARVCAGLAILHLGKCMARHPGLTGMNEPGPANSLGDAVRKPSVGWMPR